MNNKNKTMSDKVLQHFHYNYSSQFRRQSLAGEGSTVKVNVPGSSRTSSRPGYAGIPEIPRARDQRLNGTI